MTDKSRNIINSQYGLSFAYLIGQNTPEWLGRRIARFAADFISERKDWKMVRAARCNQWVVHGEKLDKIELDQAVRANFRYIADSIYDLNHYFNDATSVLKLIEPDSAILKLLLRAKYCERGLVVAGVHLSNFDMIFQMAGVVGFQGLALTLPELNAGYKKQLELRIKKGVQIIQASVGNIKHAVDYLKKGGLVITGIDRPDHNNRYRPKFFGRPAAVPIHHVFLALKAKVPVTVIATIRKPDGKYHFVISEPIEMQTHPDRHAEIVLNAERILQEAEKFIKLDPSQWAMTFPVWPDAMAQIKE